MDDMILYHGSRNGLKGHIKPCSRPNCDFGQGVYMGTNEMQTKGLNKMHTVFKEIRL